MRLRGILGPLTLASVCLAQAPAPNNFDRSNLDPSCKPCEDFWRYANGGWLDKNPIPARYPSWGTIMVLRDANKERLRTMLEAPATASADSGERKVREFYSSCMDTARIDALGAKPIEPDLKQVERIRTVKDIGAVLATLQQSSRAGAVFLSADQDLKDSKAVIADINAGGLSLPDRDYYTKQDARSKEIREAFVKHVAKMMELLGDKPQQAEAEAKTVLSFETALAESRLTNVERRDPYAQYHKMDFASLEALTPNFDWRPVFRAAQVPETSPVNVGEPAFLKKLNEQLVAVSVSDWKAWLRWRIVQSGAPHLSKPFVDEDFAFRGTTLIGVKEQEPRWQKCIDTADRGLGEAMGQMFVKKYFPPEAKRRMNDLVENLRAKLREELEQADWLEPATRKNAVAKLNAFVAKIGYPDRWRDYSRVKVEPGSYFGNVRTAAAENRRYELAKIGKPVDRNDWGMTPPTVNAYYNPAMNEIAFPAGILQPPFFDMGADDAANYGAIGAVIGHEMGHGFDDQGSKFDAEGNLKNWWTAGDRKQFEDRAGCVIEQFDTLDVGDGLHHNGKLVVGEAMGDLGGLTLAYKAWQHSLKGKPAPGIEDGFTPDQRFFLAFAKVWGQQYRAEAMRLQLNTNPHPLPKFRANGTLQNMPEFRRAFGCKEGDAMVRPANKQCKLW